MTFIDICRELNPELNANENNIYQDYTKKLKDIFASLGIIEWLDSLKVKGEYDFPDECKDLILFLLKEHSGSLSNIRNESKQNEIQNKDIIFIYQNIDILFKGRVEETDLRTIKKIICDKFYIPERYSLFLFEKCEKRTKETLEKINRKAIPDEARILLRDYYTKELCTVISRICTRWEEIACICDEDNTIERIEIGEQESQNLSDSFSYLNDIYSSIVADYYCPEYSNFELNDKLKKINKLELIQTEICYLAGKRSKTGKKKSDTIRLEKLRKEKKALIQQRIEKELKDTGLDFSEVLKFKNTLPRSKKTPIELVHGAIDFYLSEQ